MKQPISDVWYSFFIFIGNLQSYANCGKLNFASIETKLPLKIDNGDLTI